ncbi:hypothetical protein P4E94_13825 [Pontiellaceae bacterium B12219]|nr:hypothetical protein [Pontiellaceae bacterium B12219]
MNYKQWTIGMLTFGLCLICNRASSEEISGHKIIPSHADAAVILAKYSGLFDRYVPQSATLNDCVAFMNEQGVYFGLMEVVNGSEFTVKDCARVMGQIELIFSGEAEFQMGKVLLPKGIASWEEFCTMEDVDYEQGYKELSRAMRFAAQLNW